MDLNHIERLMQLLENSSVNELEVTEGNLHIRMAKAASVAAPIAQPPVAAAIEEEAIADDGLQVIVAGLPGSAVWVLGLLVGINLLFTGVALLVSAFYCRSLEDAAGATPAKV